MYSTAKLRDVLTTRRRSFIFLKVSDDLKTSSFLFCIKLRTSRQTVVASVPAWLLNNAFVACDLFGLSGLCCFSDLALAVRLVIVFAP
jgi:hypothetical protein